MLRSLIMSLLNIKKSIQAKIFIAFITVSILVLLINTFVWYINSSNIIINNSNKYEVDNISRSNESLEILLKDIDNTVTIITYKNPYVIDYMKGSADASDYDSFQVMYKFTEFLQSLYITKAYTPSIAVVRIDGGKVLAGRRPIIFDNIPERPWFKKVLDAKGNRIIIKHDPSEFDIKNTTDNEPTISIGRAVMEDDRPLGIATVDIDYSILRKYFNLHITEGSSVFIIDEQGDFIYNSNRDSKMVNIKDSNLNTVFMNYDISNNHTIQNINGKDYLVVYYKSEYTGWTTIGMVPKNTIMSDVTSLRNKTGWFLLLVVGLTLLFSIFISYKITNNIKKLRNAMNFVGAGNLDVETAINSVDEVGQLNEGFHIMVARIKSLMVNLKNREQQKREAELQALQAQINPHFLYNTLNTIRYLAKIQNVTNIEEITISFIELLRISIGNNTELITIQEELEQVKSYINIQKYKYTDKFSVIFQVEEDILKYKTLKLILQPIVENALIHGIEPSEREGIIDIKIYRDEGAIKIITTDNGVGIEEVEIKNILEKQDNKDKKRFSGIGIGNVNERIKLHFGNQYGIQIFSQLGVYTAVEVTIPTLREEE